MAQETPCLTPGAQFHTEISGDCDFITLSIDLPPDIISDIPAEEAELLERLLHNAIETVLRPYFVAAKLRVQYSAVKRAEGYEDPPHEVEDGFWNGGDW